MAPELREDVFFNNYASKNYMGTPEIKPQEPLD